MYKWNELIKLINKFTSLYEYLIFFWVELDGYYTDTYITTKANCL